MSGGMTPLAEMSREEEDDDVLRRASDILDADF
jgi:hypothetical protein